MANPNPSITEIDIERLKLQLDQSARDFTQAKQALVKAENESVRAKKNYALALRKVREQIQAGNKIYDDSLQNDFITCIGWDSQAIGKLRDLNYEFKRHRGKYFCMLILKETSAYGDYDVLVLGVFGDITSENISIESNYLSIPQSPEETDIGEILLPTSRFSATFLYRNPQKGKAVSCSLFDGEKDDTGHVFTVQEALREHINMSFWNHGCVYFIFGNSDTIIRDTLTVYKNQVAGWKKKFSLGSDELHSWLELSCSQICTSHTPSL